jgi:preprotein translocase subunit YajC
MNMFNKLPIIADTAASDGTSSSSMLVMIGVYVLIFAALYFFMIRPSSKKKKEEAEMRSKIDMGDEITTIGGIVGRVVAKKEDEDALIIETGPDRVKMKFKTWCISSVDTAKDTTNTTAKDEQNVEKKGFFGKKKKSEDE